MSLKSKAAKAIFELQMYGRNILLNTIEMYQRRVSPYKPYRCAHAAWHGGRTCSQYGYVVLRRKGVMLFFRLMLRRFKRCESASGLLIQAPSKANSVYTEQKPSERCKPAACCLASLPFGHTVNASHISPRS